LRSAADRLGPVTPDVAKILGVNPSTPVLCGIHDSNASLLPHLLTRDPPFSVVSTGTWVIACTPGGSLDHLDAKRDCLANIDALGRAVPSARFMGGREFSLATKDETHPVAPDVLERVLRERMFLLPSLVRGSGPFPDRVARWTYARDPADAAADYAVVSCYLALVTAECLRLAGSRGSVAVEGPFAANPTYLQMLKVATGQPVFAHADGVTGTAIGAALLAIYPRIPESLPRASEILVQEPELFRQYAADWRRQVNRAA
jgi:sugar (pentulose or hexulose) kinase